MKSLSCAIGFALISLSFAKTASAAGGVETVSGALVYSDIYMQATKRICESAGIRGLVTRYLTGSGTTDQNEITTTSKEPWKLDGSKNGTFALKPGAGAVVSLPVTGKGEAIFGFAMTSSNVAGDLGFCEFRRKDSSKKWTAITPSDLVVTGSFGERLEWGHFNGVQAYKRKVSVGSYDDETKAESRVYVVLYQHLVNASDLTIRAFVPGQPPAAQSAAAPAEAIAQIADPTGVRTKLKSAADDTAYWSRFQYGTQYGELKQRFGMSHVVDCSFFTWMVYEASGAHYEYAATAQFLAPKPSGFDKVDKPQPGDIAFWHSKIGSKTVCTSTKYKAPCTSEDHGHVGIVSTVGTDGTPLTYDHFSGKASDYKQGSKFVNGDTVWFFRHSALSK